MAEKKIIVDFEINAEDIQAANDAMARSRKETEAYQKELNELKLEQKELNALYKIGAIDADQYAKQQTQLKSKTSEVNKSMRESNKTFQNNKTVIDAAKGSNDQLRARLSLLTKQYNGLSKEQRENSKEGKQMGATIKTLTDKLKSNEKAVGDNRRNVGNYSEAIESAMGNVNVMGVNVGNLVKQLKTQKEGLIAMRDAQVATTASVGLGTTALKLFKAALASTGIGLLIVAVASLVAYFTQTKRGVELLEQAFAGIKATISVLTDRLSGLTHAFTLLKEGKFAEAGDHIAESFKGIGKEIVEDAKAASHLEKQMQKLKDAERALKVETADRRAEVAALQLIAEDETKTFKERGEAIKKANEIQKKQMETELALQQDRVRIVEEQLALGENLEEDENRLAEERSKLGEIEANNLKKLRSLKAKENSIRNQEHTQAVKNENELRKLSEDRVKQEEAAAKERAKIREQFRQEQLEDAERQKEAAIEKANELRAAGVDELEVESYLNDQLLEIHRAERDAELQATLKTYEEEAEAARVKVRTEIESEEARKAALMLIDQELLEAKQQAYDLEAMQYQASVDGMAIIDEERQAKLLSDKAEVDAQLVELDRQKTDAVKAHLDEVDQKQKQNQQNAIGAVQGGLGAIGGMMQGIGDIMNENIRQTEEQAKAAGKTDEKIRQQTKAAKKEAHQLAVAAAIVQTFQAGIAAYQSGAAVPVVGVALGPVMAAAALAFGFAQVAQMKSTKFAKGGVLQGPSHAQGGIPISVNGHGGYEAEGDEIVLTKGVYRNPALRARASELNQLGGGDPLHGGTYFANGGVLQSTGSIRQSASGGNAAIVQELGTLGDRIEQIQPVVRVSDINRTNGQMVKVQSTSDL